MSLTFRLLSLVSVPCRDRASGDTSQRGKCVNIDPLWAWWQRRPVIVLQPINRKAATTVSLVHLHWQVSPTPCDYPTSQSISPQWDIRHSQMQPMASFRAKWTAHLKWNNSCQPIKMHTIVSVISHITENLAMSINSTHFTVSIFTIHGLS